jgi:hypothetical protein
MVLDRCFACSPSFAHIYFPRSFDITLAISSAARAASGATINGIFEDSGRAPDACYRN